ncbi:hypothetical protein BC939DRAFT_463163 [Gamsiella multidivaricata]|uniref:uncharacterized protein n=1 Tax=Gamsiella multidivaricata TaxID=101098 RepID=UPI00221EE5E4|nr:uncharacterized protein BC939DRAFT_463163 [Gamsiella multidivaricata]KAG0367527.1 Ubiquilin-4 [Gamsiella multidivaricata]KAI7818403.1 hypothetical protein BC939DRAFT_463163 [Gamsiella multidivaricata]
MSDLITINIKASSDRKYVISVATSETVLSLKAKVGQNCETPAERMRLIYSGRVLKDGDTLATYNIAEGHTVHMVRSAAPPSSTATATSTTVPAAATVPTIAPHPASQTSATRDSPSTGALPNPWTNLPSGSSASGPEGLGGFGGMAGMPGMGGMDPAIMSQMMQDPNFAQYMSAMLQNPQVLESMMSMNPALQAMGPQARQMLHSPQFMQMISNPEMLRRLAMSGTMGSPGAGTYSPWGSAVSTPASPASNPATAGVEGAGGAAWMPAFNPFVGLGGTGATANPTASFWAQQMGAMGARTGTTPHQTQQPPEERFQIQLKQLNEMGFYDAAKNIRALLATGGNVNGAVEILFRGGA